MFALPDLSAMSTSTLVETVSLDYDDFSESFLTCGTCLCQYDGEANAPKLLPCSHTVCRSCLERIVDASRDNTQVRCPICRESIPMPRGGVSAFPPSFIVNQLLDLMARQRRDVIPKCSEHASQELLFCETCDAVFCLLCTGGSHNGRGAAHTVIPFSIAIKRMSEILLYKASLCLRHLGRALDVVAAEMDAVDASAEDAAQAISEAFSDVSQAVEQRRRSVLQSLRKLKEDKQRVLKEQLDIISAEKCQVESQCHGLQQQLEVRHITRKISDLNDKLDVSTTLAEPRENSFLCFEYTHNDALRDLAGDLDNFGRIRISKTFPALCTADVPSATVHLRSKVAISTVDYHGEPRRSGADPVVVSLHEESGKMVDTELLDHDDGQYSVLFTPAKPGKHNLNVSIFGRPIRDSPFSVQVSEHNNPVMKVGGRGAGHLQFIQPCAVLVQPDNQHVHILDTGNSRIQVLAFPEENTCRLLKETFSPGLEQRGCTGMSPVPTSRDIAVINWRTKYVSVINEAGDVTRKFTCSEFSEPTSVAVNHKGEIIVADNGHGQLLKFDTTGKLALRIGNKGTKPGSFRLITSIYVAPNDDILVTDMVRLQVFSPSGKFLREVPSPSSGKAQYGGAVIDQLGNLLATRQEKGRCVVQVFDENFKLRFTIDSHDDKLSRPSGLAVTNDGHVIVADLGNDCVKKYRYM